MLKSKKNITKKIGNECKRQGSFLFHLNVKVDLREATRRIRPSVHLEPHYTYTTAAVANAAVAIAATVLRSLSHVHLNLHLYLHMQCTSDSLIKDVLFLFLLVNICVHAAKRVVVVCFTLLCIAKMQVKTLPD